MNPLNLSMTNLPVRQKRHTSPSWRLGGRHRSDRAVTIQNPIWGNVKTMSLNGLNIWHLGKTPGQSSVVSFPEAGAASGFQMETCQRWLRISWDLEAEPVVSPAASFPEMEHRSGLQAYRFLLSLAVGLESEVVGETEVFGQIKAAWKKFESSLPAEAARASPWMQKLFEDAKEIRSQFLRSMGGNSYGSLVRSYLKKIDKTDSREDLGPVLIVGAGQMAQVVSPWLKEREIWILNRSQPSAERLKTDLLSKGQFSIRLIEEGPDAERKAWALAQHVIVCIPQDHQHDEFRIQAWKQGQAGRVDRSLLHLGIRRGTAAEWESLPSFACLDDIFELQSEQGKVRSFQIALALKACDEKAKLRELGGLNSISHGWEDLALFG